MVNNLLETFENKEIQRLTEGKPAIPNFQAGDTVKVNAWVVDGKNKRIQTFEGLVIARKNRGLNSSFTVRKISHGEGVERIFQLYSPLVESIELVRRGVVRRAKLYYMRERTGKAARIKEKMDFSKAASSSTDQTSASPEKGQES